MIIYKIKIKNQIIQLKNILAECDKSSLILIDEIGSGTDPQEGGALAAGVLDPGRASVDVDAVGVANDGAVVDVDV